MPSTLRGKDPADAGYPPTSGGRDVSGDGGFSLIEVLVAIAVIGTVMTAMAPFLVQSLAVSDQQRSEQVAIQVANDALERVRALDPSSLLTGRGHDATRSQWTDPKNPPALARYLASMERAWDLLSDSSSGRKALLPTVPYVLTVNGTEYEQQWYIGYCWQTKATSGQPEDLGDCQPTESAAAWVPFFRVVVAVTWEHRSCPAGKCVYIASSLVSKGTDPTWMQAPPLTSPGDQTSRIGTEVALSLPETGGGIPLVWSASGLPDGLTINASTGVVSGTPTSEQSLTTTITATAADDPTSTESVSFGWRVLTPVLLADPGAQNMTNGDSVSLALSASGGLLPYTWRADDLPNGLSMDPATGTVTGTVTRGTRYIATIWVTDNADGEASMSVVFNVAPSSDTDLTVTMPSPSAPDRSTAAGSTVSWTAAAAGGSSKKYIWSGDLPPGLDIASEGKSAGEVSGKPTLPGTYPVTLTVTVKNTSESANLMFIWIVT